MVVPLRFFIIVVLPPASSVATSTYFGEKNLICRALQLQKRAGTVQKSRSGTGPTFVLKLLGTGAPGPTLPILLEAQEIRHYQVCNVLQC